MENAIPIIGQPAKMNLLMVFSLNKKLYEKHLPIPLVIETMQLSSMKMYQPIQKANFSTFSLILDVANENDVTALTNIVNSDLKYDWLIFIRINRDLDSKGIGQRVFNFIQSTNFNEFRKPTLNNLFVSNDKIITAYHKTFDPKEFVKRSKG